MGRIKLIWLHYQITQHAVDWTFGGYVTAHLNFSGYLSDLNFRGKPHVKIAFEDYILGIHPAIHQDQLDMFYWSLGWHNMGNIASNVVAM